MCEENQHLTLVDISKYDNLSDETLLYSIPANELRALSRRNAKIMQICNDEGFWHRRLKIEETLTPNSERCGYRLGTN